MTREQEHSMINRLNELKDEYAEKLGWDQEEYWWEDDEKLYEAECYAYGILEKEYGVHFAE